MKIQFLGAAQQVTGSKHLITTDKGHKILLDCGMYQGKGLETDAANRDLGFDPREIDCVVLSHAHIDHSGLLPYIYKLGFRGDIYSTPATRDLCAIMLEDTAYIQALDAKWYNKKIEKKKAEEKRAHKRGEKFQSQYEYASVLYDSTHVQHVMQHFVTTGYDRVIRITDDALLTFTNSGHMLGSAVCNLTIEGKKIAYTGDLGRMHSHILSAPKPFAQCDYLICESTYGDRIHEDELVTKEELLGIVKETCEYKKGKLIIPSFSVGRTQEIVYVLNELYNEMALPKVRVYVDSPLAVNATHIFRMYMNDLNEDVQQTLRTDSDPFGFTSLTYITDINQSKRLNTSDEPCIIISASGMLEAGRVKHHVANHISDPTTTILIVGYCTPSSLGARIQDPKLEWISIFGIDRKIKAQVTKIEGFSGHGDWREMTAYLQQSLATNKVRRTFIVHGEKQAQVAYEQHLHEIGLNDTVIPALGEEFIL